MSYSPAYVSYVLDVVCARIYTSGDLYYLIKRQEKHPPYLIRKGGKDLEKPIPIKPARPFMALPAKRVVDR